jgi:hypothetical protein
MLHRKQLYFMTRGNADGVPYIDLQLRPKELQAIGHVATQWAFLELMILRETRSLALYLDIPIPDDAAAISFRRKARVWEDLSLKALAAFDEERRRALDCIVRAKGLANERHRLMHDIIEYDTEDQNRLKAFPPATLGKFGWPIDAERIERTAHDIARLTHDVLSIHSDPQPAPDASQRIRDSQDRNDFSPDSNNRGRRRASSRSPKRRR